MSLVKQYSMAQMVENLPAMRETRVQSLGQEAPLDKRTVIHSYILAWRIPWTRKPGGLQSVGLQRVRQYEPLTHSMPNSKLPEETGSVTLFSSREELTIVY